MGWDCPLDQGVIHQCETTPSSIKTAWFNYLQPRLWNRDAIRRKSGTKKWVMISINHGTLRQTMNTLWPWNTDLDVCRRIWQLKKGVSYLLGEDGYLRYYSQPISVGNPRFITSKSHPKPLCNDMRVAYALCLFSRWKCSFIHSTTVIHIVTG